METKTIKEIALAWKDDKRCYVKRSTFAAYVLILENHILPSFGECDTLNDSRVQDFVLRKLDSGLCVKTVKDILFENGDEVRREERVDELLRMGYQISDNGVR